MCCQSIKRATGALFQISAEFALIARRALLAQDSPEKSVATAKEDVPTGVHPTPFWLRKATENVLSWRSKKSTMCGWEGRV